MSALTPQTELMPQSILMVKAHSAGVGDVLRSSAAWRTLKNKWPNAKLHLLFLTKLKGYAVEELIKNHHLLSSSHFVTIRSGSPHEPGAKNLPIRGVLARVKNICDEVKPDLVIDFEASGLRTSIVTRTAAKASRARAVGIKSFFGRQFFYDDCAPSMQTYATKHGLTLPMDYTHRDYVVLAALGLEREGQAIELQVQPEGVIEQERLKERLNQWPKSVRLIGLNIGCGTPDALHKRPNLELLVDAFGLVQQQMSFVLLLSGAAFERDINQKFIAAYQKKWGDASCILDWAGESSISGLTGVIDRVEYFISTDSGPYHMAVALRKPTLVLFTYAEVTSFHEVSWCEKLIAPYDASDIAAKLRL